MSSKISYEYVVGVKINIFILTKVRIGGMPKIDSVYQLVDPPASPKQNA